MADAERLPEPDPGNSGPELWSEPLPDDHQQEVRDLLGVSAEEDGDQGGSES